MYCSWKLTYGDKLSIISAYPLMLPRLPEMEKAWNGGVLKSYIHYVGKKQKQTALLGATTLIKGNAFRISFNFVLFPLKMY